MAESKLDLETTLPLINFNFTNHSQFAIWFEMDDLTKIINFKIYIAINKYTLIFWFSNRVY